VLGFLYLPLGRKLLQQGLLLWGNSSGGDFGWLIRVVCSVIALFIFPGKKNLVGVCGYIKFASLVPLMDRISKTLLAL